MFDFQEEMALQENREAMISLAWRYCFDRWIEGDQRRVIRIWNAVRSHCDLPTTQRMVVALSAEFGVSAPVARDHLARTVDLGLLSEKAHADNGRIKIYGLPEDVRENLVDVFGLNALIDQVINLQRAAPVGKYDAGKDLLPTVPHKRARKREVGKEFTHLYVDSRDPDRGAVFNDNVERGVEEMRQAKKGKPEVGKLVKGAVAALILGATLIAAAPTVSGVEMADGGKLYIPSEGGERQQI